MIWQTTGLEMVSFHSNPKERRCQRMLKLPHNCTQLTHTSKVMLQILQARLQQYVKQELPDAQAGFRKGRETQISNCKHLLDHGKSKKIPKKNINSASLTLLKPLTVWTTTNCGKFLKIWEYQTILSAS